jgi:hypothetical protein
MDARVAIKYVRENSATFSDVLSLIAEKARRVFDSDRYATRHPEDLSFYDVVQPYSAFTSRHVSLRAGLWVHTPPGINTVIGPLVNHPGPLNVVAGSIETDWHHFELFIVAEIPDFDGRVLVVEPQPLAQLYFVNRAQAQSTEIRFSTSQLSADPPYWDSWSSLAAGLVEKGKGQVVPRTGVASVDLGCPHCWVSVTAAIDNGVPDDHVSVRGFNPAYKVLKQRVEIRRNEPPSE